MTDRTESGLTPEGERRFHSLADAAFEALAIHDAGSILLVNRAFCDLFRIDQGAAIGRSVLDFADPASRADVLEAIRSGRETAYQAVGLCTDGTRFLGEVRGKQVEYEGRMLRAAAIRDITAETRAAQRMAIELGVASSLARGGSPQRALQDVLAAVGEATGWTAAELWERDARVDALRLVAAWDRSRQDTGALAPTASTTTFRRGEGIPGEVWARGEAIWLPDPDREGGLLRDHLAGRAGIQSAYAFPVLHDGGTVAVVVLLGDGPFQVDDEFRDTSQVIATHLGQAIKRRAVEDALRESEARYRTLVEHAPGAIVVLDLDTGRFVDANGNAEQLYGLPRAKLFQRGPVDLSPPFQPDGRASPEAARGYLDEAIAGKTPAFEWVHKDAAGNEFLCEVRLVRLPAAGRRLVRGSVLDITSRKRAESQLRVASVARPLVRAIVHELIEEGELQATTLQAAGANLALRADAKDIPTLLAVHAQMGLGDVRLESEKARRYTFGGADLIEQRPSARMASCSLTLGFLRGMLGHLHPGCRVVGAEVSCQSRGDPTCRFVLKVESATASTAAER